MLATFRPQNLPVKYRIRFLCSRVVRKTWKTNTQMIDVMDDIESKKEMETDTPIKARTDSAQGEVIVSEDGIVLHPQAVDDALDPLNWSSFQKHTILAIVMAL